MLENQKRPIRETTRFKNEMRALWWNLQARAEFPQRTVAYAIYKNFLNDQEFSDYVETVVSDINSRFPTETTIWEGVVILKIKLTSLN